MKPRNRTLVLLAAALGSGLSAALMGCASGTHHGTAKVNLPPRYESAALRKVPFYLRDSVIERCDLINDKPMDVSSFGLVANLHNTGDTYAGTAVRQFITTEIVKRGLGSHTHGTANIQPEDILKDSRWSIIRVDVQVPPAAKAHQRCDAYVTALDGNNTASLAHGDLYQTELKWDGANLQRPNYAIDIYALAQGALFVNPAQILSGDLNASETRASLRQAVIIGGGYNLIDRPLILRLRQPQMSMSRGIQLRLGQGFQEPHVAAARDEALINLYMPSKYGTDWEHFAGVVLHTFLNSDPGFALVKAKQLVEEAQKPDAALQDISFCWEALGPTVVPIFSPLLTSPKPDVAFAAARAGAFLGDETAQDVLMEMAEKPGHPFQINAVQTLAKLPSSPSINLVFRKLLGSDKTLVRLEAYEALADNEDAAIDSHVIDEGKFRLDIVPADGPPLIYATTTGEPRIAVIGRKSQVALPIMFSAMENKLTISSDDARNLLSIYYRGADVPDPVSFMAPIDVSQFIARLGGEGAPGDRRLRFDYCTVVALLQTMSDQKRLVAEDSHGKSPLTFVLQDSPRFQQSVEQAPEITPKKTFEQTIEEEANSKLGQPAVK